MHRSFSEFKSGRSRWAHELLSGQDRGRCSRLAFTSLPSTPLQFPRGWPLWESFYDRNIHRRRNKPSSSTKRYLLLLMFHPLDIIPNETLGFGTCRALEMVSVGFSFVADCPRPTGQLREKRNTASSRFGERDGKRPCDPMDSSRTCCDSISNLARPSAKGWVRWTRIRTVRP